MPRFARAVALAGCLFTAARPAHAQPANAADSAHSAILFEEGRALMKAGRYVEACARFEESHRAVVAPGTLLNLADCYERIGRTASAWELYLELAQIAKSSISVQREALARQPMNEAQRREAQKRIAQIEKQEAFTRDRAAALAPKLSRLRVTVSAPPAGLLVQRDGVILTPAEWGAAVPVDPGYHLIEASAPNKVDFRAQRYVSPGATQVTIDVPALVAQTPSAPQEPAPKEAAPKEPAAKIAAAQAPPKAPEPEAAAGSWRTPVGYTMTAAGVAALGAGTVFFVHAASKPGDPSRDWETPVSLAAFAGAGALIATGLYFVFSAPPSKAPTTTTGSGALLVW